MSHSGRAKTYAVFNHPSNKKLISQLAGEGAELLVFPLVSTQKLPLNETSRMLLENLIDFHWIVFPDVFAVDYFIAHLEDLGIDLYVLDELRVCAFGEAVSDRLRFVQIHADVIPSSLVDQRAIVSAIAEYAGLDPADLRFLLPHREGAEETLAERLRASGAEVEKVPVYAGHFADRTENLKLKTLLKGGAADEFIFSSPEEVLSLEHLFPAEDLGQVLENIKISATNEQIFQNLAEKGLRPLYFHPQ